MNNSKKFLMGIAATAGLALCIYLSVWFAHKGTPLPAAIFAGVMFGGGMAPLFFVMMVKLMTLFLDVKNLAETLYRVLTGAETTGVDGELAENEAFCDELDGDDARTTRI